MYLAGLSQSMLPRLSHLVNLRPNKRNGAFARGDFGYNQKSLQRAQREEAEKDVNGTSGTNKDDKSEKRDKE